MRPFSAAELTRMRTADESTLGDDSGIGSTAVVKRVASGDDASARTTVVTALQCGRLHVMDEREKELADMAKVRTAMKVKVAYNAGVIRGMRLIYDSVDYRIVFVRPYPINDPQYMWLFLADEGVAA